MLPKAIWIGAVEELFFSHLDHAGDFLDIGANIGYYSVYGAPVVRRVFSFEPDSRNRLRLEENARQTTNIFVEKYALSDHEGGVKLDVSQETSVSRVVDESGSAGATVQVRAGTLDGFAKRNPDLRVTGIKLDTEGHELAILSCAGETIRRDQPLILTELLRSPGKGLAAFRALAHLASELHYELFAFVVRKLGFIQPGTYSLLKMTEDVFLRHATKMMFLVPRRLQPTFVGRATLE